MVDLANIHDMLWGLLLLNVGKKDMDALNVYLNKLHHLFYGIPFMPHGHCYFWLPSLVTLHVFSDGLIALSYMLIPFGLAYFLHKRKDLPFSWMFVCFALFIFSCGATHVMEIWTLWRPDYWTSGFIKLVTGIVSFTTAILLIKLIPVALKLPSPKMLHDAHQSLLQETQQRKEKEIALEMANEKLQFVVNTLKSAQNELKDKNVQLQQANNLKSQFLENMSHELRTPLNGIIGFSNLLYKEQLGPVNAPAKEYAHEILKSSYHLYALINNILEFSFISSEKPDFHHVKVSIESVLRDVTSILEIDIAEKQLSMQSHIATNVRTLMIDRESLKNVLFNYLANAVKFTEQHGKVVLRFVAQDKKHLLISVQDNGIGIAPDNIPKVFLDFQQLDDSSKKKYAGVGVGLILTRKIVEAQGGKVWIESEPGKGSTFYALLPCTMLELVD